MCNLRESHASITEKIRVAHALLGTETNKRQLLHLEEGRLRKLLGDDRAAIVELAGKLEGFDAEEKARKVQFMKEMHTLNDELESSLTQYEEKSWMNLITFDSIQLLIEEVSSAGLGMDLKSDGNDSGSSLTERLTESFELLQGATEKINHKNETRKNLEEEVRNLRAKALLGQGATNAGSEPLGEMEIDELERLWEQTWEAEDDSSNMKNPEGSSAKNVPGNEGTHLDTQEQTVNMDLFYGNAHEHDEQPVEDEMEYGAEIDSAYMIPGPENCQEQVGDQEMEVQ